RSSGEDYPGGREAAADTCTPLRLQMLKKMKHPAFIATFLRWAGRPRLPLQPYEPTPNARATALGRF
ncbi:MAG TPA: hypothetical protein PKD90_20385, partial [Phnomibacter sp.]|nr:hypothetical protein [Phnomibacter sp.]